MIYYQKHSENTFEYDYLSYLKQNIKENPNINCYIGFDFGFFHGTNIYYGSNKNSKHAKDIYNNFIKNNIDVRLFCNIPSDFDVIILLGYSNIYKERYYLLKHIKKIMKAISFT